MVSYKDAYILCKSSIGIFKIFILLYIDMICFIRGIILIISIKNKLTILKLQILLILIQEVKLVEALFPFQYTGRGMLLGLYVVVL